MYNILKISMKGDDIMAKKIVTIRLEEELKTQLEQMAKKQHRSLTNFLELLVLEGMQRYQEKETIKKEVEKNTSVLTQMNHEF